MHKLWVNAIQNPLLCGKDQISIYKTYRVCHTHFGYDQKIEHGRRGSCLKLNAIPTLNFHRIVIGKTCFVIITFHFKLFIIVLIRGSFE